MNTRNTEAIDDGFGVLRLRRTFPTSLYTSYRGLGNIEATENGRDIPRIPSIPCVRCLKHRGTPPLPLGNRAAELLQGLLGLGVLIGCVRQIQQQHSARPILDAIAEPIICERSSA
jgi:hypothetical protein